MLVRSKLQQVFFEKEQLSTRHAPGAAYRFNETTTSTPLPSLMSYTDTESSRVSFYCNDLIHHSSSLKNTESSGVSQYSSERREDVSYQQPLSIQNYIK